jgi:hypothetical protein
MEKTFLRPGFVATDLYWDFTLGRNRFNDVFDVELDKMKGPERTNSSGN